MPDVAEDLMVMPDLECRPANRAGRSTAEALAAG